MSRRTGVLCQSSGHVADTSSSPSIRGRAKHLECDGKTEEHLEKRRFYSRAIRVQSGASTTRTGDCGPARTDGGGGIQAADEAQGVETKCWARSCSETCGR